MPVFAVQYAYADRPEALTEVRPRHREFLAGLLAEGVLLASGPYVTGPGAAWAAERGADDGGPGEQGVAEAAGGTAEEGPGALLLVRAESAAAAAALLEPDPFFLAGLIDGRSVRGWVPVMGPFTAEPTH